MSKVKNMSCKINKSESIFAIKQYIAKEPENMKFHYANILVHANKKRPWSRYAKVECMYK